MTNTTPLRTINMIDWFLQYSTQEASDMKYWHVGFQIVSEQTQRTRMPKLLHPFTASKLRGLGSRRSKDGREIYGHIIDCDEYRRLVLLQVSIPFEDIACIVCCCACIALSQEVSNLLFCAEAQTIHAVSFMCTRNDSEQQFGALS